MPSRAPSISVGHIVYWATVALVVLFILLPLVVVAITSFFAGISISFPPERFSLEWYRLAWHYLVGSQGTTPVLGRAVVVSLAIASLTSIGAAVIGVASAYGLHFVGARFAGVASNILLAPLLIPTIATGIALLVLFSAVGIEAALPRLLAGHILITSPYVLLIVSAALKMISPSLQEAALTLGATRARAFMRVTLPLVKDAVFAGMAFAFLISFNHFTITFFLYSGDWKPLPMWIVEYLGYNLDPLIAVISTGLVAFTLLSILGLNRILGIRRVVLAR